MMTIQTENSTYEIDAHARLVRRSEGEVNPTPRFGHDGVWRPFKDMTTPTLGEAVTFTWEDGGQTITSFVRLIATKD